VSIRAFQFFLCLVFFPGSIVPAMAGLTVGESYPLQFIDLDGNTLLTNDGHVSIIVLTARSNWTKALEVGDRVPDSCLQRPDYRLITVVDFGQHSRPIRALLKTGARVRFRSAIRHAQSRYDLLKIERSPQHDIFVVTDFDGATVSRLGSKSGTTPFQVFVFDRAGKLLAQWNDVPTSEQLLAVLQ